MDSDLRLFISHSGKDAVIAEALIELIKSGLELPASAIRCTSVNGYRLSGGAKTDEQLRIETLSAHAFVGLISPNSIGSMYVAFELGARWGAGKHLMPILAPGVDASILEGPLSGLNALSCDSDAQLHQMISDLGNYLELTPVATEVYVRYVGKILKLSPYKLSADESGNSIATRSLSSVDHSDSVVTRSFSSFVNILSRLSSEQNKIKYLSENEATFPDISCEQLVVLLGNFSSESNKLTVIAMLKSRLGQLTDRGVLRLLSLFATESNKLKADALVRTDSNLPATMS